MLTHGKDRSQGNVHMALDDNRLPTGETESKVSYLLAHLCCLVMLGSQHLQHLLDIHPQRCTKLDCGR